MSKGESELVRMVGKSAVGVYRQKVPITITLTSDQVEFIDAQCACKGERSRWIRDAIDREIYRKKQFERAMEGIADGSATVGSADKDKKRKSRGDKGA
jgi:hypothetical protein